MLGNDYRQRELAAAARVTEFQVSRWHQQPEFYDALAAVFRRASGLQKHETVNKLWKIAGKGNVLVFNALCDRLERWGLIPVVAAAPADGAQTPASVNGVEIHIHGIPEPASRATLPPVLELPATPHAPTTTPK